MQLFCRINHNHNCHFHLLPQRRGAGFTLIEMIVTVAIAAIVMMIAVPSFQQMMQQNRTAAITNQLLGAFRMARSEAVTRGKTVTVCKSANVTDANPTCSTSASWADGWIIFAEDGDGNGTRESSEPLIKVGQLQAGQATVGGNTYVANTVQFLPSGRIKNRSGGTLTITTGSEQTKITINAVGRITSERVN